MKFRKKPVVIEAFKLGENGTNEHQPEWYRKAMQNGVVIQHGVPWDSESHYATIKTLEGEMKASHGDYIIQGINGELYPCKPDIFEKTYEPA